jgi:uncharacterized membrane protein
MNLETFYESGIGLIIVGSVVIAIAFLLILSSGVKGKGRIKSGGVVLIGQLRNGFGYAIETS